MNVVSSIDRIKMFYVRKIHLRKIPVQFGLGRQLNTSSFEKIICAIPFDENLRAKRVYWWWHWYNAKGLSSCLLFLNLAMPWSIIFFPVKLTRIHLFVFFFNCHCCKKKKLRVSKIWNVWKKKKTVWLRVINSMSMFMFLSMWKYLCKHKLGKRKPWVFLKNNFTPMLFKLTRAPSPPTWFWLFFWSDDSISRASFLISPVIHAVQI